MENCENFRDFDYIYIYIYIDNFQSQILNKIT